MVGGGLVPALRMLNYDLVQFFDDTKEDAQVYIAVSRDRTRAVVSFRGTTNSADALADLHLTSFKSSHNVWKIDNACQTDCNDKSEDFSIHAGVCLQYKSVDEKIDRILDRLLAEGNVKSVLITGHSLGKTR